MQQIQQVQRNTNQLDRYDEFTLFNLCKIQHIDFLNKIKNSYQSEDYIQKINKQDESTEYLLYESFIEEITDNDHEIFNYCCQNNLILSALWLTEVLDIYQFTVNNGRISHWNITSKTGKLISLIAENSIDDFLAITDMKRSQHASYNRCTSCHKTSSIKTSIRQHFCASCLVKKFGNDKQFVYSDCVFYGMAL
jgi:hypothetical protein